MTKEEVIVWLYAVTPKALMEATSTKTTENFLFELVNYAIGTLAIKLDKVTPTTTSISEGCNSFVVRIRRELTINKNDWEGILEIKGGPGRTYSHWSSQSSKVSK